MSIYIYISPYVSVYIVLCDCVYKFIYVREHGCFRMHVYEFIGSVFVSMYVCVCVYVCLYLCLCMSVYERARDSVL